MDLAAVFDVAVERNRSACAFVDGSLRRSFEEWRGDIDRVAASLSAMQLGRGDHLVCTMSNRYEMATLYWACQLLGAIFTPFNWRATADEIAFVLRDADVRIFAFDDTAATAARHAIADFGLSEHWIITVDAEGPGHSFDDLLSSDAESVAVPNVTDSETCLMLYTSGTTGSPKGVPRSHRAERIAAASCIAHLRYRFGERNLGIMPLFHTMGIRALLSQVMLNGTFVCMRGFDPRAALALVADEAISTLFMVPTMFHDMLAHSDFAKTNMSSVRNVAYAGMSMTDALERRCADLLKPEIFANYYGSTEVFTFTVCDYLDRKPGCAGVAGLNQMVRVVRADADGLSQPDEIQPPGEIGEIIASMQSPEAFTGYWRRPDADERAIRNGWYFTGDLGYTDQDGALFLAGRIDDMIISGGENIHPEEVENTLADCPLVSAVAIVGFPDERWGQNVVAFIEPADEGATARALDAHCIASALARFKRPRTYIFIERIPRSASGKLLRRLLREGAYEPLSNFDSNL
jgi:2-furoate---CoA ligase